VPLPLRLQIVLGDFRTRFGLGVLLFMLSVAAAGGRRLGESAVGLLVVALFAGLGIWIAFARLGLRRRQLRWLAHGRVAPGTSIASREARWTIDDVPETTITFEFEVDGRAYQCEAHTFEPEQFVAGAAESIVYDPAWPDHATPLRHLPGSPTIGDDDRLTYRLGPITPPPPVPLPLAVVLATPVANVRDARRG